MLGSTNETKLYFSKACRDNTAGNNVVLKCNYCQSQNSEFLQDAKINSSPIICSRCEQSVKLYGKVGFELVFRIQNN